MLRGAESDLINASSVSDSQQKFLHFVLVIAIREEANMNKLRGRAKVGCFVRVKNSSSAHFALLCD